MALVKHQIAPLDAKAIDNLRGQIEETLRNRTGNRQVEVVRVIASNLGRPSSRSYRAGGPIDLVVENSGPVSIVTRLWIKVANHPKSGFFDELKRLYDVSLQRDLAGLIPLPYAYDPESGLLVTQLVAGICPLQAFIRNSAAGNTRRIVSLAKDVGKWLASFHSLDWSNDGPSIEEWASPLCDRMLDSGLYSKDIVNKLVTSDEFNRARHVRLPLARQHKDFTLRNILCTHSSLQVIDWDAMGHPETPDIDTPWNDIGAFLINVESQIRSFPLIRNGSLRLFEQTMLDSYDGNCPGPIGPRKLASLLVRLRYDVELIGPSLSRAYRGVRGAAFRHLFRRRLRRRICELSSA